jgi:hypothetical protein
MNFFVHLNNNYLFNGNRTLDNDLTYLLYIMWLEFFFYMFLFYVQLYCITHMLCSINTYICWLLRRLTVLERRAFKIEQLDKFFNRYNVLTYHLFIFYFLNELSSV